MDHEYILELHTESVRRGSEDGGKRVGCDVGHTLTCRAVICGLLRPVMRVTGESRWYHGNNPSLSYDKGVFLFPRATSQAGMLACAFGDCRGVFDSNSARCYVKVKERRYMDYGNL